jgi:hypothetical protein
MNTTPTAVANNYPAGEAAPKVNRSQEALRRLRQNYSDYVCEDCGRELKHHSIRQLVECNEGYEKRARQKKK